MTLESPASGAGKDGTQQVLQRLETRIIPDIKIPENVLRDISVGTARLGDRFRAHPPQGVLTLDRSGTLLWDTIAKPALERHGVEIPQAAHVGIGTETTDRWFAKSRQEEYLLFERPEIRGEYYDWLAKDRKTQSLIHGVAQRLAPLNLKAGDELHVVDDTKRQWTTLGILTPYVVTRALQELNVIDSTFDMKALARSKELVEVGDDYSRATIQIGPITLARSILAQTPWLDQIRSASGVSLAPERRGTIPPIALDKILQYLMKGQAEKPDGTTVPLTWDQVTKKGAYYEKLFKDMFHCANPAEALKEQYGETELLSLHKKVRQALLQVGSTIKL